VRVNLIHSTLVFQENNIVHMTMRLNLIHSNNFFKKNYTKIKKLLLFIVLSEQCNSFVLFTKTLNSEEKKQLRAASANPVF